MHQHIVALLSTVVVLAVDLNIGFAQDSKVDLHVAVFAYLPDASAAIEKLEDEFEARYASIDLDIELLNPYDDEVEMDGLSQLVDFDVVEIDVCRIDQLMGGALGGIDKLPATLLRPESSYVGPAKTLRAAPEGNYVVPHWMCGNFLVTWQSNNEVNTANTFTELLAALNPDKHPILAPMWGRTTLGEYYADAMLDMYGPQSAREHLNKLGTGEVKLDSKAARAVVALADELPRAQRGELKHFDEHAYYLPRLFASDDTKNAAVLLGYSERLYYAERERQLGPGVTLPAITPKDVCVRQFSFADKSQGTPCWVDGFVVPKGKFAGKQAAISAFLLFIQSPDGYRPFAKPGPYFAATNLLPASSAAYEDEQLAALQPTLSTYRDVLGDGFLVQESTTWKGMREAGAQLRDMLKPKP